MSDSTPTAKPRRRLWRKLFVALALLGIAFYAYLWWQRGPADAAYGEAAAEADRLDPGWRLEELEAKRAVIPDNENSATIIMSAMTVLRAPNIQEQDVDLSLELGELENPHRLGDS